jgi:transposase
MQIVHERCCGLDVHKKSIVACLLSGATREVRTFPTLTSDIRTLALWLSENNCRVVGMESTGSYWKPIYNILELLDFDLIVANAQHIKNVPGRKTDVKDAEWIAQLLRHGLINPSFIPDKEHRETREIVRYRKSLINERARELNRLEKILQGGNIKLSSVVSQLTGLTSQELLRRLAEDSLTAQNIDDCLHGSLREKREELLKACEGMLSLNQRILISAVLDHIQDMTRRIGDMDRIILDKMRQYDEQIARLKDIPGIGQTSAQTILAEIGADMSRFPTQKHLSSWAGLSPGNYQSAGRSKSGRPSKGNKTLKSTLIQSAQTASRTHGSFFKAQYQRLVVSRGSNRAKVAVAHSMLIAIYHMLSDGTPFRDLGESHYDQFNTQAKVRYYLKKLGSLGVTVPEPV